jgi:hypothetical protein
MAHRRATACIQAFALAAALWAFCMHPAAAETGCAPTAEAGVERCVSGLPAAALATIFEPQQASNWCWAASIAMILRRYGVSIAQDEVVRTAFDGRAANERASVQAIGVLLNRGWGDAQGHALEASAQPLAPWRRSFGLAAPEVLEDLAQGKPLLLGAQQHAMVLVQVTFERRVDGRPLTPVGVRMLQALVLDPASRDWLRGLQASEGRLDFLARISVQLVPAGRVQAQARANLNM